MHNKDCSYENSSFNCNFFNAVFLDITYIRMELIANVLETISTIIISEMRDEMVRDTNAHCIHAVCSLGLHLVYMLESKNH